MTRVTSTVWNPVRSRSDYWTVPTPHRQSPEQPTMSSASSTSPGFGSAPSEGLPADGPRQPTVPAASPSRWAPLRPLVLRLHFYAGVLVTPFLLVAATTGLMYAFSFQAEKLVYAHELTAPVGSTELPISRQVAAARTAHPEGTVSAIRPSPEPGATTYLRSLGALATTYGEGWVQRVRQLGRVDAALDLAGSGVIRELVELTGDPRKVVSIADLGAPEVGVRFSGVAGSVPEALAEAVGLISRGKLHIPVEKSYPLAEAAAAHTDSQAGHTRGRRVLVV
ncbi:zinc-binding dehydrogenase [Streptomyces sp. NPDC006654]|uniref:zinc-binding dehydrogenase n=1 Tax=Streptomyces sp. NPDC006654 TaxID=3156897 RepID=UPI0033E5FF25